MENESLDVRIQRMTLFHKLTEIGERIKGLRINFSDGNRILDHAEIEEFKKRCTNLFCDFRDFEKEANKFLENRGKG